MAITIQQINKDIEAVGWQIEVNHDWDDLGTITSTRYNVTIATDNITDGNLNGLKRVYSLRTLESVRRLVLRRECDMPLGSDFVGYNK